MHSWIVLALLAVQAPASGGALPPQPPAPAAPAAPADAAAATFATDVGLLLVAVKPDKTTDYEAALAALQQGLATTSDPALQPMARGWRVYKATEPDAKGNALYVHAVLPAVAGADYRPSLLLDQLLAEAPIDLLAKYKEALAGPPTRLSLTEVANMSVVPVKK